MSYHLKFIFAFFIMVYALCCFSQALPVVSISNEEAIEGRLLIHTVTLATVSDTEEMYDFNFNFVYNTIVPDDIEYISVEGGVFFTNSTSNIIVVPSGLRSFTIVTATRDDSIEEETEFYTLTVNGISAMGNILDNDANTTSIISVSDAIATEGNDLIHTVYMSNPISGRKNFPVDIIDMTTSPLDYDAIVFSDGIIYDASTELLIFPAQNSYPINSFTITIPAIDDLIIESDETYTLTITDIYAMGTIRDNDTVTITSVRDASETEGADLVHTIFLSNRNPEIKSYTFLLVDNTTDGADYGIPVFDNGVSYNPDTDLITLPIGITSFTITIPTIDDIFDEAEERYDMYIEDFSAVGIILDNDTFSFPKFFSPNGDNVHDTWPYDLVENNYFYNNAHFTIVNRYGKVLKEFTASSGGWDGTYNSIKMPESDYWYRIVFEDGKVHYGNFTLKR